jgi:hypothetical protein
VIRTLSPGLEDRYTAINAYAALYFGGSYGSRTRGNRSTICDVSRYTNEPCNLQENRTLITRMKILYPEPLDEQTNYRGQPGN